MLYQNEIDGAKKLATSIKQGHKINLVIGQPQTGKSNTIREAMVKWLHKLMFVVVTPIRELNLLSQLREKLETDNSIVMKLSEFKTYPNPDAIISDFEVDHVVVDETHFGNGIGSHYNQMAEATGMDIDYDNFDDINDWKRYAERNNNVNFTIISATPFGAIHSGFYDNIITLPTPANYCGAEWMLNNANLIDIEGRFRLVYEDDLGYDQIEDDCYTEIARFNRRKDSIALVRASSTDEALRFKALVETNFKTIDTIVIGGDLRCDYSIEDGVDKLKDRYNKIKSKKGKTIFVCIGSLRAGADLGFGVKKYINLIIDPSNNWAAWIQGLAGRAMGYDMLDRDLTIIGRIKYLEAYVEFINNPKAIVDDPTFYVRHNIQNAQTHLRITDGLGRGRRSNSNELSYVEANNFKVFELSDYNKMFKWLTNKVNAEYGPKLAKQLENNYSIFNIWAESGYTTRAPQFFSKYSVASRNTAGYSTDIDGKQINRAIEIGKKLLNKEKIGLQLLNQFFTKGNYENPLNVVFTVQNNPKLGEQFVLAAVVSKDKMQREHNSIVQNNTFMAK